MGFLKKLFVSGKKEEEKVDEEVIEEPIENKEEVNEEITQPRNFLYLDFLIHSGVKEIVLDADIALYGGGDWIYRDGIQLDVDDLVVDGNGHTIDACGKKRIFYCSGKNITIKNITLKNGYADNGGAIYNDEGGELTVSGSTLEGNTAQGEELFIGGGAIHNRGKLTVSDSTLTGNTAHGKLSDGGAIYNCEGTLTVSDSTLKGNMAEEYGGAIHNRGGELTVSASTLEGNTANSGGAIYNVEGGELTVSASTLEGNTARFYGGAIHNRGGELTVSGSTLEGNIAKRGGAIYNKNLGRVTVSDSTLTENIANGTTNLDGGGAIYNVEGGEFTVSGSTLEGNTANSGGGIYNDEGNFKVFNCDFSNNKSLESIIYNKDSLQFYNSNFMSNHAPNIIVNNADSANVSIFNGEFKDNNIKESIIFNDGKSCTVEKTIFEKHPFNTLINKSDLTLISPKIKDEGKVILNEKYILIRKSSDELEDKIYGDGIVENEDKFSFNEFDFGYLDKKIHESKTKEIILEEDISFENYEIDYYEGGIELDIDNLIIDGNGHTIDAKEKTRIFYCTGKNITIKNFTLKNGHTHKNYDNPLNNNGGAIKINHNTKLTIENCKFINNTSEENSGAIHNSGELIVSDSNLTDNRAEIGGGAIYNSFSGELTVFGSTLEGNTANSGGGGAIYNSFSGELTVSGSTLTGNTAGGGGAIYNSFSGELTVSGSTLEGNTAEYKGGAIYNGGELIVSESTLCENTANYGGAIENIYGELTVSESTLCENTANYGGAIYNDKKGRLIVSDSILEGNTAEGLFGDGGAIYLKYSKKYESENCTFKGNKPDDVYEQKD